MKTIKLAFVMLVLFIGSTALFAQQFQSGKYSINNAMQNYTLDKESGQRSMLIDISFLKGFDKKPSIMLSVTLLDSDTKFSLRYSVEALSVSRDGFTLKVTTWGDSKIMGIAGNWLAVAEQ
jgi:hypothetical protein